MRRRTLFTSASCWTLADCSDPALAATVIPFLDKPAMTGQ
jgi:hypothetical protein